MANPDIVIDGAQPYGSRQLVFSNGATVIADEFRINTSATSAEDRKISGAPNRKRWTRDRYTGTATLQAPNTSGGLKPKFGDTFTVLASSFDANYANLLFVISAPVPYNETNDPSSIRKYEITFEEVINTITTANG